MEEKFDKLISLIEEQNKAWSVHLEMTQAILNLLNEDINSQERMLQEHPTVRTQSETPRPAPQAPNDNGNFYSDVIPYGTEIEEEKERDYEESIYAANEENESQVSVQEQSETIRPIKPEQNEPEPYIGEGEEDAERVERIVEPQAPQQPLPPVSSKAEMLERQVTLPKS